MMKFCKVTRPNPLAKCIATAVLVGGIACGAANPALAGVATPLLNPLLGLVAADLSNSSKPAFTTEVLARGLHRPNGIAIGFGGSLYFTEIPNPRVSGGANAVVRIRTDGKKTVLRTGEPEPTNIVVGRNGTVYWTCRSAGVILMQTPDGKTTTVLRNFKSPTGLAVSADQKILYFTEVPTPGMATAAGGRNRVKSLNLRTGQIRTLDRGDPEPTDIAVDQRGNLYWTCRSAGVIVRQTPRGVTTVIARDLKTPTGIAIDSAGSNLYFTEVPTPGVSGTNGGTNAVKRIRLSDLSVSVVNEGDPDPVDVAVDRRGSVYWTCRSAGVIVKATPTR